MSGSKSGVATRISKDFPMALYEHCHNHKLNLAIVDACSQYKEIRDTLNTIENIYAFVERSAKRHAHFQHIQDSNKKITLKKYCQTRWSSHLDALKAVVKTFTEIQISLRMHKYFRWCLKYHVSLYIENKHLLLLN
jgi:hypoxanthine phosphoribosyltransferase